MDIIIYQVIGGRRGGYRGFTFKENIWPGPWRIDVKTADDMVLGKIKFQIIRDSTFHKTGLAGRRFE